MADAFQGPHSHVFLGEGHERNERRTWMVIALCTVMMIAEIVGGWIFGSIALVADGLHMSTHASALLLAAAAYSYARTHAEDERFSFGTGKLGDLAGFTSAVVLAMIAILIGYEAVVRLIWPIHIEFNEAIPIAVLGLAVNVASVLLLSGGRYRRDHDHGHSHHHAPSHGERAHRDTHVERHAVQTEMEDHEHAHGAAVRDNNMRTAIVHVLADAGVSVLVIVALLFGRFLGWSWMDPVVGLAGAIVIAAWSYSLIRDTGAILLDMTPDRNMAARMRAMIETDGDRLTDLHVWRLGPGHLGAILSVATQRQRGPEYYMALLRRFRALSHVTVQVQKQ